LKRLLLFTFLLSVLASCLDSVPRDRPTFAPTQSASTIDPDADEVEVEEVILPSRPDGIVFMQPGHCGCLAGEPVTLGTCQSFCSSKSAQNPTLFVDIEIDEANSDFGINTLNKWCTQEITYEDPETGEVQVVEASPSCRIEIKDEDGSSGSLDFTPVAGATSAQIDITNLDDDKTYRMTFVELVSGARSNTIQVRKVSSPVVDPVGGPLAIEPVFKYACMNRLFISNDQNGQILYETFARQHYYFIAETRPEPLPGYFPNIYCHDYQTYGETPINNPLIEETPGHFFTWKKWDPRFFDLNENQKLEIHEILEQKIIEQGSTVSNTPEVFFELDYPNGPQFSQSGDGSAASSSDESDPISLGFYMTPFIDFQNGYKAYCPTQANYYGTNPLLVAMRDVVGVDTEALYIAKQDGVCDFILIPENIIKNIWFYLENGNHIEPNSDTIAGKQVQFYWPADPASPFIKKSNQRVYTLKSAAEVGSACSTSGGNVADEAPNTSYPPHDKRIGCIPKL